MSVLSTIQGSNAHAGIVAMKHYQNISNEETTLLLYGSIHAEHQESNTCQPIELTGWMWHFSPAMMVQYNDAQTWLTECKIERKDITIDAFVDIAFTAATAATTGSDTVLLYNLSMPAKGTLGKRYSGGTPDERYSGGTLGKRYSGGTPDKRYSGGTLGKRGKFVYVNNIQTDRQIMDCWSSTNTIAINKDTQMRVLHSN